MELLLGWLQAGLSWMGSFILLLGLLIFVHELGHFLVAKYFKVRVETFSLGFGKRIFQFKKGETTYCLSLIPLGGYVKMYGDDPTADVPEDQKPYAFLHKPVGPRIAIVLAGPLMNLFFAGVIFSTIIAVGHPVMPPVLGDIKTDSQAYQSGFRDGDRIVKVNGEPVEYWEQVESKIRSHVNQTLNFKVHRASTDTTTKIKAQPSYGTPKNVAMELNDRVGKIEGLDNFSTAPLVGIFEKNSPAAKAGFRSLDLIKKIDGEEVRFWRQIAPLLKKHGQDGKIQFKVQKFTRENDGKKDVPTRSIVMGDVEPLLSSSNVLKSFGFEQTERYLMQIKEDSPADQAGLQRGDKIVAINGQTMSSWQDILKAVKG